MNVNSSSNRGEAILAALKTQFPGAVLDEERQTPEQVTITVKINLLPDVVHYLYYQHDGWLPVLFGNDERTLNGHYAVYYALSMEGAEKCWIVVKALVDADSREFPSVTPRVPAAVWGEREIRDMYGLIPVGLPDQRRLVLPDDWPEDMHPLRKDAMDYRLRPEPTTDSETYPFINEGNSDARVIPVGPLHITSDEPGHFRLFVDGEQIVDADYRLFYVHRGMEKLAETRMGYNEVTFLSDRVCGICGFAHSVAYTNSVENALGIEVPQRAHTIRSILLEVERLHSHLLNLGLSCHFVGFDTGFIFANIIFRFLDMFLLLLIGTFQRLAPLGTLFNITRIISFIFSDCAMVHFQDTRSYLVQEIPVMRNDKDTAAVRNQIAFQPFEHIHIKMVCRFIEKQVIWAPH